MNFPTLAWFWLQKWTLLVMKCILKMYLNIVCLVYRINAIPYHLVAMVVTQDLEIVVIQVCRFYCRISPVFYSSDM